MHVISNATGLQKALDGLDVKRQRLVAARFVENVIALCSDERIVRVVAVAGNSEAGEGALTEALKTARAATIDSHIRCGSEGDWSEQAGYFAARAASIVTGDDTAGQEGEQQYRILSEFLDS